MDDLSDPVRPPVILVVDDEGGPRARVERELVRRHGSDYRIVAERSPEAALAVMRQALAAGDEVALVLADQWMPGRTGGELLSEVPALFPRARRGLLVDFGAWGDPPTAAAILRAMGLGHCDYYVLKPWRSPDEYFNRTVSEFLHEWARSLPSGPREVIVVGAAGDARAREIHSLLVRNGIPSAFRPQDDARAGDGAPAGPSALPAVVFHDGRVLERPSNAEIAEAFGLQTTLQRDDYDVAVVGAGPGGLAAAVYAASEGLETLVIEREAIGGQAGSSSLIRNYLGFARGIGGAELAMRAYQQAWVFGASFLMMREVRGIAPAGRRLELALSDGNRVTAGAVVLATGVDYRRLGIPALEALVGAGVFYGASVSEALALTGESVYVVGGGNSAGQAALHLSRHARQVTILVRGASLVATMSRYLIDVVEATPNIAVRTHAEVVDGAGAGHLERLVLRDRRGGGRSTVEAAALFVLIGAHPHSDWLPATIARDEWGYVVTGADLTGEHAGAWPPGRPPRPLETSLPGVFAVGDVRHRSMKRVAASVGEGAGVIPQVHEHLAEAVPPTPPPEPHGTATGP